MEEEVINKIKTMNTAILFQRIDRMRVEGDGKEMRALDVEEEES